MSGSAVPDTAGGPLDTTGTASTVPTSAAMDSAASHHELGISPFADSDDSSSPSPVSTDHILIDVRLNPHQEGLMAYVSGAGVVAFQKKSKSNLNKPHVYREELQLFIRHGRIGDFRLNPDVECCYWTSWSWKCNPAELCHVMDLTNGETTVEDVVVAGECLFIPVQAGLTKSISVCASAPTLYWKLLHRDVLPSFDYSAVHIEFMLLPLCCCGFYRFPAACLCAA
ncbi:hypothetical protein Tco_0248466 [Tanacetum coccineum]